MHKSYQRKNQAAVAMILSMVFSSVPVANAAPVVKRSTNKVTTTRYNTAAIQGAPLIAVPFRSWIPKRQKPRVVLLCIHALGFSSNSYDNFGRRMAAAGIPTFAMDVRGFGKWMTRKDEGEMDFEACLTDVEQAVKTLHAAYPKVPVFLVGESMGGAIAIQAASRYPDQVNGLVSAVPSATSRGGGMLKSGMVVAYHTTTPMTKVDMTPVVVDGSTSNEALRQKIEDDPNNRMELSRKEIVQFERFMKATHDAAPLVERTPALVLVAYKDKLVTPGGSVDLFTEMTTAQKLMIGDGNSGHLMLEEGQMTPEIERILKSWLFEKSSFASQSRNVASN